MIMWDDRNPWLYLPGGGVRETVTRQARDGDPRSPSGPYAFHPGNCSCAFCAWVRKQNARLDQEAAPFPYADTAELTAEERAWTREQNARLDARDHSRAQQAAERQPAAEAGAPEREARQEQKPVPAVQRAACGHPYGCALLECLARRILAGAAAGKAETAGPIDITVPGDRVRASGSAGPCLAEPPDPAGEVEAALREFDVWYLAGKGALPDPEPLPAGVCRSCRLSMAVTDGRCFWCCLAEAEKNANLARAREAAAPGLRRAAAARRRRIAAGILVMLACWAAVIVLGVTGML